MDRQCGYHPRMCHLRRQKSPRWHQLNALPVRPPTTFAQMNLNDQPAATPTQPMMEAKPVMNKNLEKTIHKVLVDHQGLAHTPDIVFVAMMTIIVYIACILPVLGIEDRAYIFNPPYLGGLVTWMDYHLKFNMKLTYPTYQ